MRIAPSFALITGLFCSLLWQPGPHPDPATSGGAERPATIEPVLPLTIDLQFELWTPKGSGWHGVVQLEVAAGQLLPEVSLRLMLPEGVGARPGVWMNELAAFRLEPERPRRFTIPIDLPGDGSYAIQVEAVADLADGGSLRTRQGRTLHAGRYPGEGRYRLGAYEVMGVPAQDLEP